MLSDFGNILLFIISGIIALTAILGISKILRPNNPNEEKLSTYESGEAPIGTANVQFNLRFYVVAIIFVLFEAELLFLFPWSVVFGQKQLIDATNGLWGWFAITEMFVFIGVLVVGLAYCWKKGYFDWQKPDIKPVTTFSKIPKSMYDEVNKKYS